MVAPLCDSHAGPKFRAAHTSATRCALPHHCLYPSFNLVFMSGLAIECVFFDGVWHRLFRDVPNVSFRAQGVRNLLRKSCVALAERKFLAFTIFSAARELHLLSARFLRSFAASAPADRARGARGSSSSVPLRTAGCKTGRRVHCMDAP